MTDRTNSRARQTPRKVSQLGTTDAKPAQQQEQVGAETPEVALRRIAGESMAKDRVIERLQFRLKEMEIGQIRRSEALRFAIDAHAGRRARQGRLAARVADTAALFDRFLEGLHAHR